MPRDGHSSHLALGPQPFKGLFIPSLAPECHRRCVLGFDFENSFLAPTCQLNGRSRTERCGEEILKT